MKVYQVSSTHPDLFSDERPDGDALLDAHRIFSSFEKAKAWIEKIARDSYESFKEEDPDIEDLSFHWEESPQDWTGPRIWRIGFECLDVLYHVTETTVDEEDR